MNIKRYLAKDNAEAMQMIKEELGSDAVIINSRRIRPKGIFGFFKKPITEVVVAIDQDGEMNIVDDEKSIDIQVEDLELEKAKKDVLEIGKNAKKQKSKKKKHASKTAENPYSKNAFHMAVESSDAVSKKLKKQPELSNQEDSEYDEFVYGYYQRLIDINTRTEIVDYIFEQVLKSLPDNHSKSAFKRALRNLLREKIGRPYKLGENSNRNLIFIGPTGVGKTTTIAKVAAKLSIFQNKNVGLITADTFRIAAVEQLKTYAQILGLDVSVVYEAEELKDKLRLYQNKDYVILDSAGRNHKSDDMKKDVIELLEHFDPCERFLVLSLGSSKNDIKKIIESYEFIGDFNLVFTKMDETENLGNILNARFQSGNRIGFITNGQNVPDDILTIDVDDIVDLLLGEE